MAGRCELDGGGAADQLGRQSWTVEECTGGFVGKGVTIGGVQEVGGSGRGGFGARGELKIKPDDRGIGLMK